MTDPILLQHILGHLFILLRGHLQLDILIFSNVRHFDLFTEPLENTIISRIDGTFELGDFSVDTVDCF